MRDPRAVMREACRLAHLEPQRPAPDDGWMASAHILPPVLAGQRNGAVSSPGGGPPPPTSGASKAA